MNPFMMDDPIPRADNDCELLDLCTGIGLSDYHSCKAGGNVIMRCKPGQRVLIKLLSKTVALLEHEGR